MTFSIAPRHTTVRALVAIALLSSAGAFAQRAALVQNVDDGIRAPLQVGGSASGCGMYQGNCAVVFPAVPAGHRYMVEQLSCYIPLKPGGVLVAPITLGSQSFRPARTYLPAVSVASGLYAVNAGVLMYYEAGEQPRVDAFSSGAAYYDFSCTLSGRDIALP